MRFRSIKIPTIALALVGLLALIPLLAKHIRHTSMAGAAVAPTASHGLRGHYYTRNLPTKNDPQGNYDLRGYLLDEYNIPTGNKPPDAIRIDPKIAFGRGKGFVPDPMKGQLVWWTPEDAGAIVWKGYVRLPKAGTYYFVTASNGTSAVYLHQSRVALNGSFGGSIPSAAFTYEDPAVPKPHSPYHAHYAVPITAESARVLPIEVRYAIHGSGGPRGIDLYWVTPDARRDAQGKPIAEIVPAEVLYVEPPEPIQKPVVRGANSTISSDFLYLPVDGATYATLTVRLADEHGRPVAGKRVHVSGLVSYGGPDEIIQPEKPTDASGITTAKVKAGPGYKASHESKLFATDVTDLVDVAQVAHLEMAPINLSFLPLTYAPYYDDQKFRIAPQPVTIGKPVTITVPLTNRHKEFAAELTATFRAVQYNIGWVFGSSRSDEIGKVENIRLRPGETKEISIKWTPKEHSELCFRIDLSGRYLPKTATAPAWLAFGERLATIAGLSKVEASEEGGIKESRQRNMGPVTCPIPTSGEMQGPPDPRAYGSMFTGTGSVFYEQPRTNSDIITRVPMGFRCVYRDVVYNNGKPTWYYCFSGIAKGWVKADNLQSYRPLRPIPKHRIQLRESGLGLEGSACDLVAAARG